MSFKNHSILITGGAGFIGSHLARKLVSQEANVTVFDNFSAGKIENISDISKQVTVLRADIRDYQSVRKAVEGNKIIFHLAASASVPNSVSDPAYDFETNALGTLNILKSVLELESDARIIYASTAAVYGEPHTIPIPENHCLDPVSPYGVSKLAGELYCRMFWKTFKVHVIMIRYFNVFGPAQPRYVLHDFLAKLEKSPNRLDVLGTGEETRDFIHVSDAVDATLTIARNEDLVGQAINAGSGHGTKIGNLARLVLDILGYDAEVVFTGDTWKGDITVLVADVERLRELGFSCKMTLEEGCRDFVEWYRRSGRMGMRKIELLG